MKNILVVVAHPDDEVLGMGGTIAKLVSQGNKVNLLIVTDGSSSQYRNNANINKIIEEKMQQTRNAADILGISEVFYGGLPDMKLDMTPHVDVNQVIEKLLDKLQPDTIFTHFWGDVNLDHQSVFRSVLVAARPLKDQFIKQVYCFQVPSSTEWNRFSADTMFMPNTFVDITDFTDIKYRALNAYSTELRDYPHPRSIKHVQIQDAANGIKVGLLVAEDFVLVRNLI